MPISPPLSALPTIAPLLGSAVPAAEGVGLVPPPLVLPPPTPPPMVPVGLGTPAVKGTLPEVAPPNCTVPFSSFSPEGGAAVALAGLRTLAAMSKLSSYSLFLFLEREGGGERGTHLSMTCTTPFAIRTSVSKTLAPLTKTFPSSCTRTVNCPPFRLVSVCSPGRSVVL